MEGKSPPGDRNSGPINIPRIYFSNVTLVALFPRRQKEKKIPDILYDEPTEKMGPCRMNQHSILHGYYRPRRGLSDVVSTAQGLSLSFAFTNPTNNITIGWSGFVSCFFFLLAREFAPVMPPPSPHFLATKTGHSVRPRSRHRHRASMMNDGRFLFLLALTENVVVVGPPSAAEKLELKIESFFRLLDSFAFAKIDDPTPCFCWTGARDERITNKQGINTKFPTALVSMRRLRVFQVLHDIPRNVFRGACAYPMD